jgi:hypothetical protein
MLKDMEEKMVRIKRKLKYYMTGRKFMQIKNDAQRIQSG